MSAISPTRLAIMLGSLVALGPLAIDTYLPALPTMADDFGVAVHAVELSVSFYVIGVALGQWLGGPLSDHFGRKPVAYVGLLVFFLASLAIAVTESVQTLYLLRVVQAVGGGATVVICAASVRDHFTGPDAGRVLTTIGLVMLMAPLLAPAIGAALLKLLGWQSIFLFLAVYAVVAVLVLRFALPTVVPKVDPEPLRHRMFAAYGRVLRQRAAMGFILANSLGFSAMFIFITDAAFLYIDYFGIDETRFPIYFGCNILTMLSLNRLNVLLLRRYRGADILGVALVIQTLSALALLVLTLAGTLSLWNTVPLIMMVAGMGALIIPNAIASFLAYFDSDSGAATGLNGCLQFLLAGLIGTGLGMIHDGTPLPMTGLMAATALAALGCYWGLARRS
ncbi:Bcr/CflA family multidrug resistance transporter [Alcanivorax balearicus MACL04]|uniref:Bcr/CflA family efflux transporter n=1 Tax=Alloalcanivorax balearicus MACL04 TaxID=1177182 RepID=A0ABT2R3M1_9GAMM|nr:multidrug effflux MFS transporter [Alloalcanivorax balearicus]MCU5784329.1 Bcr/CflA family multidrug resistance transporter [Alloalcanivorax balearicus MACL04]